MGAFLASSSLACPLWTISWGPQKTLTFFHVSSRSLQLTVMVSDTAFLWEQTDLLSWRTMNPNKGKNICSSQVVFFCYCRNGLCLFVFLSSWLYFLSVPHFDSGELPETLAPFSSSLTSACIGLSPIFFSHALLAFLLVRTCWALAFVIFITAEVEA